LSIYQYTVSKDLKICHIINKINVSYDMLCEVPAASVTIKVSVQQATLHSAGPQSQVTGPCNKYITNVDECVLNN
jgi:hypothetical protein